MEITSPLFTRFISAGLATVLVMPPSAMAGDEKPDALPAQQSEGSQTSSPPVELPAISPTLESQPAQTSAQQFPDSPGAVQSQTNDSSQPSVATGAQSDPQQPAPSKTQKPVGAAAAEAPAPTGEAAFKPAGAAIAPATQRRRRMLLIKVGALIGAGVAIGSVAALSSASPSRPPGSH